MKKRLFRLGALCCVAAMTITTGAQALSVEEAYDILQRSYVDKLPRAAQDAKSLDELFSYTDDYTYYMTAEEYQAFLQGVYKDLSVSWEELNLFRAGHVAAQDAVVGVVTVFGAFLGQNIVQA